MAQKMGYEMESGLIWVVKVCNRILHDPKYHKLVGIQKLFGLRLCRMFSINRRASIHF